MTKEEKIKVIIDTLSSYSFDDFYTGIFDNWVKNPKKERLEDIKKEVQWLFHTIIEDV